MEAIYKYLKSNKSEDLLLAFSILNSSDISLEEKCTILSRTKYLYTNITDSYLDDKDYKSTAKYKIINDRVELFSFYECVGKGRYRNFKCVSVEYDDIA